MITKDEASDLKSFIDRAQQTSLDLQMADLANKRAQAEVAGCLWKLQQKTPA
jgi:hypothetical protein